MKIGRLDLTAFGHFSGTTLDLSASEQSFQVILGPNAAGKSTALRAIIDLLFGIPERTTDDFLHASPNLRIGAELIAADGRRLSVVRRKGRKNTLLDPAGKPVPESELQAFLGVLDRDQFVSMFGLDHERLRRGADDLLRAGGALGESLFEAAGGTRSIRAVLELLKSAADDLFRPRASTPAVNRHIAAYDVARKQARELAVSGEKVRQAEEELATLAGTIEAERAGLLGLEADLAKIERIQRNLPRAAQRAQLLGHLAALDDVPDLPTDARDERLRLTAQQRQLAEAVRSDEAEIMRLEQEVADLDVPEALLAEGPILARLNQRLGAEHKAAVDRPKLETRLAALHEERDQLLADARPGLSIERAQTMRPTKPQAARVRELAASQGVLQTTLREAERSVTRTSSKLQEAEGRLAQQVVPHDTGPLAEVLRAVRAEGNVQRQRAESVAKRAVLLQRADAEAAALPHWDGPLDTLVTLAVPLSATVHEFVTRLGAALQAAERARDRADAQAEVLETKEDDLARLRAAGAVPTNEELEAARARRADGWTLIRRGFIDAREDVRGAAADYDPERPLPEAYELSVATADDLADRLRADADRVARHESLHRERAEAAGRLADERERLARAEADREATAEAWCALWRPLQIDPRSPAEMIHWLEAHRRIRETVETARVEQQHCDTLDEAIVRGRALLLEALRRVGRAADDAADLGNLTTSADAALAELTEAEQDRMKLEGAVNDLREQVREAEEGRATAAREFDEWQREWAAAVGPLGYDAAASPTELGEFLRLIEEALQKHVQASEVARRLQGIDRDERDFTRDVTALRARAASDLAERPAVEALGAIVERHEQAVRDQATRTEKQGQLRTLRVRVETTRSALANVAADIGRLLARASCNSIEALEAVEAGAARKTEVRKRLAELEASLVADGAGLTLEQLLAEVAGQDGDRVAATAADIRNRKDTLADERDEHLREHGQKQREFDETLAPTSGAAQAAQVAEEELAAVRDRAEEHIRLRLAEIVLREFVERYREQHQDPILQRASALFPVLTRDTFRAVRTDFDEGDRAVLIGIDARGVALRVEAMSDGTRDQLFLALRLAAMEQYLATAEPLPFVADDLLVHFDDERARATLQVLAEFSRHTQVLFFTHHRHLVELAEAVVPPALLGVRELGALESP